MFTYKEVAEAIKKMIIRGAPAIELLRLWHSTWGKNIKLKISKIS